MEMTAESLIGLLEQASEMCNLKNSIHGNKLMKRYKADLDAVRAGYLGISGNPDEVLRELAKRQGRESELLNSIRCIEESERNKKLIEVELAKIAERKPASSTR